MTAFSYVLTLSVEREDGSDRIVRPLLGRVEIEGPLDDVLGEVLGDALRQVEERQHVGEGAR